MVILLTFVATLAIYGIASRTFMLVSLWQLQPACKYITSDSIA